MAIKLFDKMRKKGSGQESLGLDLRPGDAHYRAYVGPPADYDLVAAMTFNLITTLGLRQHHTVLDIGCGSLRIGRLLIPCLNVGNYSGIEPNKWLVEEGILRETGRDQIRLKKPKFYYSDSAANLIPDRFYDYAIAQSVFSHCGPDVIERWLAEASNFLVETGALAATFLVDEQDNTNQGWIYPECVYYRAETMSRFAQNAGLKFSILDWKHPRQVWALFAKPSFIGDWFVGKDLSWNNYLESVT